MRISEAITEHIQKACRTQKEEIGWLKIPFGLLAVTDASLLGWLAQSYAKASSALVAAATIAVIVVSSGIFQINRIAYRRFDDLEED